MKNAEFQKKNGERWQRYEQALKMLENRGIGLDVSRLPAMFREMCTDLALARHRMYGTALNEHLNGQVVRGHNLIHRRPGGTWAALFGFLTSSFPRAVREEWRLLLVNTLVFLLPLFFVALSGVFWPDYSWIQAILGPSEMGQIEMMYGKDVDQLATLRDMHGADFMMFGHYVWNNIGIDFRIFAGGIFACLGSLFFLFYNGIYFGAVVAYIHMACSPRAFYTFVAGHSSFELIAMVIAGMAGMRIGLGLLRPGRMTRPKSMLESAKKALPLIWGAVLMTFIAALIEGFWSAQPLPDALKYGVGIGLWLFCFMWLGFGGFRWERRSNAA